MSNIVNDHEMASTPMPAVRRPRGRRCPNCKTPMRYIEFFDGHRCPACITIVKPADTKELAEP